MEEEIKKVVIPKKKKAKNGRKKIRITGPKKVTEEPSYDLGTAEVTMVDLVDLNPPASKYLSKLEDTLAKIRLREGRSLQLTGDAKLIIEALEYITLILRK